MRSFCGKVYNGTYQSSIVYFFQYYILFSMNMEYSVSLFIADIIDMLYLPTNNYEYETLFPRGDILRCVPFHKGQAVKADSVSLLRAYTASQFIYADTTPSGCLFPSRRRVGRSANADQMARRRRMHQNDKSRNDLQGYDMNVTICASFAEGCRTNALISSCDAI